MKKIYIVKQGDDVNSIAKKLQVSIYDLVKVNRILILKEIKKGYPIIIPENSPVYKQNT